MSRPTRPRWADEQAELAVLNNTADARSLSPRELSELLASIDTSVLPAPSPDDEAVAPKTKRWPARGYEPQRRQRSARKRAYITELRKSSGQDDD